MFHAHVASDKIFVRIMDEQLILLSFFSSSIVRYATRGKAHHMIDPVNTCLNNLSECFYSITSQFLVKWLPRDKKDPFRTLWKLYSIHMTMHVQKVFIETQYTL